MPSARSPPQPTPRWRDPAHLSHRYLLPVAAAGAATFGAALAVDFQPGMVQFVPEVLVGVGLVGLATSFSLLRSRRSQRAAASAPVPRPTPPRRPPVPGSGPAPRAPFASDPAALPGGYALSTWWPEAVSATPPAGDRLWHEWQASAGVGAFEVPLTGPVPETYYQFPTPGGLVPFEEKEPDLILVGPVARSGAAGSPAAVVLSGDEWTAGSYAVPDGELSPIEFEAFSPLPPHLRNPSGVGPKRLPLWVSGPGAPAAPTTADCVTCGTVVADTQWRPCPTCTEPICGDCVLDSLLAHGATWCADCLPPLGAALYSGPV
jgi:hypothetical protein